MSEIVFAFWPKSIHNRIWSGFIQDAIGTRFKHSRWEANKLKQDRMRTVTPYESEFENEYYEYKQERKNDGFDVADLINQKHEEVVMKMLLLYQVSIVTAIVFQTCRVSC